jgi:hypothetical protein
VDIDVAIFLWQVFSPVLIVGGAVAGIGAGDWLQRRRGDRDA